MEKEGIQEENPEKISKLAKVLGGIAITIALVSTCGCIESSSYGNRSYYGGYNQRRIRTRSCGCSLFGPCMCNHNRSRRITPRYRMPFNNSPYNLHFPQRHRW